MKLKVERFNRGSDSTLGMLSIDGVFHSFTCEDEERHKKVTNETAIPKGTYEIKLRDEGGMTKRYANTFPKLHKGMLWLQDVPGFEWVYIHIGNTDDHTSGCILVGYSASLDTLNGGGTIGRSAQAYENLYKKAVAAIESGEPVNITIS